jgi:hypothetical protein
MEDKETKNILTYPMLKNKKIILLQKIIQKVLTVPRLGKTPPWRIKAPHGKRDNVSIATSITRTNPYMKASRAKWKVHTLHTTTPIHTNNRPIIIKNKKKAQYP